MKRFIPMAAVMLCLVMLLPVSLASGTDSTDQTGLIILDASYDPAAGLLTVTWTNTGSLPAVGAELRINPLDAEGKTVIVGEGYTEEITEEERELHTAVLCPAGETVSTSFKAGSLYPTTVTMDIAFDRVAWEEETAQEDGTSQVRQTVLELPDSRLHWYSVMQNAYITDPAGEIYTPPAEEILAEGASVHLGFSAVAVTRELAEAYGFGRNGLLVISVEGGSSADRSGLLPGDLIYGANELLYDEELYMIPLVAANLAKGEAVTLLIEREGQEITLDLQDTEIR